MTAESDSQVCLKLVVSWLDKDDKFLLKQGPLWVKTGSETRGEVPVVCAGGVGTAENVVIPPEAQEIINAVFRKKLHHIMIGVELAQGGLLAGISTRDLKNELAKRKAKK